MTNFVTSLLRKFECKNRIYVENCWYLKSVFFFLDFLFDLQILTNFYQIFITLATPFMFRSHESRHHLLKTPLALQRNSLSLNNVRLRGFNPVSWVLLCDSSVQNLLLFIHLTNLISRPDSCIIGPPFHFLFL